MMKTSNIKENSGSILENALKKRFDALPEVIHTELDEDNMVKSILNQAGQKAKTKKRKEKRSVMDIFFAPKKGFILRPVFSVSLVILITFAASYFVFFQETAVEVPIKHGYTEEANQQSSGERTENISKQNITKQKQEKKNTMPVERTKKKIPVYPVKKSKKDDFLLTSGTRSLDNLFVDENKDSLAIIKAKASIAKVLEINNVRIAESHGNKFITDWFYYKKDNKYFRQRMVLEISTKETPVLNFVEQNQRLHPSKFIENKTLSSLSFVDLFNEIQKDFILSENP